MINSQYVNSVNINLSEMARITFQEQMPQHDNEFAHVVTVSMHIEFIKELYRIIGEALSNHTEAVAENKKTLS